MLRLTLVLLITITLFACQSEQKNTPDIQAASDNIIPEEAKDKSSSRPYFMILENTSNKLISNTDNHSLIKGLKQK